MGLFGTSGIRDLCPSKVNPSLALGVGNIFCAGGEAVAAGFDGRRTGHMLKSSFSAGAAAAGAKVYDIGLCSTPTLALYSQKKDCKGAMITASHNPAEYNGIKLFDKGHELSKINEMEFESEIEKYLKGKRKLNFVEWENAGEIDRNAGEDAKKTHLKMLFSKLNLNLINLKKPKIVLDCANLSACALMPQALETAGCKVHVINGQVGEPYGRELEPTKKSLEKLGNEVRKRNADLGIAHDGDADRAIILDEKGKMLGLDVQLALAVKNMLENSSNKKIVSTVESSLSLREIVSSSGGELLITPVGSLNVAKVMRERDALFGGEPCGEYLFKEGVGVPDGLMAGLYFAELFCKKGKLSSLAKEVKTYPMCRSKIPCTNKKNAMKKIKESWPFGEYSEIDGMRSDFGDWWVMVRPSGTEPYIRITIEAKNSKLLKEKLRKIEKTVKKACK
ncbi:MAG: hypothetical protein ABIH83_04480 [Candidatus Micrarchaeota archaeon]